MRIVCVDKVPDTSSRGDLYSNEMWPHALCSCHRSHAVALHASSAGPWLCPCVCDAGGGWGRARSHCLAPSPARQGHCGHPVLVAGDPGPCGQAPCAEQQGWRLSGSWRRKMRTQQRSISELEMDVLACRAVPRKAPQPEIDVLLPNERDKNGNSGTLLPLTRGSSASNMPSVAVRFQFLSFLFPAPFLGTKAWWQRGWGTARF